jgi:dipeptidyl aminopeptidase/acylaminoacyl peptidase
MRKRQLGCVIVLVAVLIGCAAAAVTSVYPFAVGVRQLSLSHGSDRPLRTVVWYPARGRAGVGPRRDATPADGRYPLILFSHGLTSRPEAYPAVTVRLAAAGFIVVAPAYPHTSWGVPVYDARDMTNQPGDAAAVITAMLRLGLTRGDPLAGHLDPNRIAAVGHSAGGYTTAGLLSGPNRDLRLRAAVIVAAGRMGLDFAGPTTPVLFIHGRHDPVVPYTKSRSAYEELSWPKAYLTLWNGDHVSPVSPANDGDIAVRTMVNFLKWALYGDQDARSRLRTEGSVSGTSSLESVL